MANTKNSKPAKKISRKRPYANNKFEVGFYLPPEASEELRQEILEVFASTPFDKISFPITTYKSYINKEVPASDNRVISVGYVKSFDAESGVFTVVIFNKNAEIVSKFEEPLIEVIYSERDGKLNVITKLNIVPTEVSDVENSEPEEETASDEVVAEAAE